MIIDPLGQIVALGPCWACKQLFEFNVDTVPSVAIDPVTQRPTDMGGDPDRARREPICPACVDKANLLRRQRGLPIITEGPS